MAGSDRLAVDSGVVAKWFANEPFHDTARHIRADLASRLVEVVAPALLPFEVLQLLRLSGEFGRKDLERAAEAIEYSGIKLLPLDGVLAKETIKQAMARNLNMFEASYAAVGSISSARLFTADEQLLAALDDRVAASHLRDYRSRLLS